MKVVIKNLHAMQQTVAKLSNMEQNAKLSYRLARILSKIHSALNDFEDKRRDLVDQYGVLDEKTNRKQVPPDKMKDFEKDFEKLIEDPTELEIQQIPFDLIAGMNVSAHDLIVLEDLVEGPKEVAK